MKQIENDNKVFVSENFQKDKYKFYLITKNLESKDLVLYSDEENYVLCRGGIDFPTWIWTKDGIVMDIVREIEQAIDFYLTDKEKDKFTCKKELYDLFVADNFEKLNQEDYFEMGTLMCQSTKQPKVCDGRLDIPTLSDKDILVKYWFDDCQEMSGIDSITYEQAENDVQAMLDSKNFYIWRNEKGKIVSMVSYNVADDQAKLSHVYTPTEERGKGYAANIIYNVTNKLLELGLVPLLYTDYNYPPSNKAYINAGYEDTGILINFSCSKQKINTRKM